MIAATIITLLVIILGITGYLAYINYNKYNQAVKYAEAYVQFISAVYMKILEVNYKMKEIDQRGSFQADDEVGYTFEALKECTEDIRNFMSRYVNTEEKEAKNS
jgi:regulator of sigma D